MTKKTYRVECNFGSKYFDCCYDAKAYFKYCKARNFNVELWEITKDKTNDCYPIVQVQRDCFYPKCERCYP